MIQGTDENAAWKIVENGYQFPTSIPSDTIGKKQYETNAKTVNTILESLDEIEFYISVSRRIMPPGVRPDDRLIRTFGGHGSERQLVARPA